jgi:AraC-like DNA-binding protein
MPSLGTAIFSKAQEYEASFREAKVNLVFTDPGKFRARRTWVELENLHLSRCQESLPRIALVSLAPTRVIVTFPTCFEPPPVWGGVELQSGDIVFHSRGERMHQRTRGASKWASISLTPAHLSKFSKAITGRDLVAPLSGRILRPLHRDMTQLRRLHEKACRLAEIKPDVITHQEVARAIEQDILHPLVNCLSAADAHGSNTARQHHASIMVRFEEWVMAHLGRRFRMPELCAEIEVSDRTLRICCAEILGMSPNRYLRLRRLNYVRAALQRADATTASVKKLATLHGFLQFGRFAVLYRTAFGETPSTTLRRPISGETYSAPAEVG